jgi:hypothetical protein
MLVRFKSTNEECHVENAAGRAYIAQGLAEQVIIPPTPPPAPEWSVTTYLNPQTHQEFLSIQLKIGKVIRFYDGHPEAIHNRHDHTGRAYCSAFGWPVPEEHEREYKRRWNQEPHLAAPAFRPSKDEENARRAKEKKKFDASVAAGRVPFNPLRKPTAP